MIELRSVTKTFPTVATPAPALHDVDLAIDRGEFVAVLGAAGSGKSTLLSLVGCLDVPTTGQVLFLGVDTAGLTDEELSRLRNRSVGFVFPMGSLVGDLTVRANVELPLLYGGASRDRDARINRLLTDLDLANRAGQPASLLSGSDQQRVAIARALVNDPDLIVADDPTRDLDPGSAQQLMSTLRDIHGQGRTVVLATASEQVARAAERVVQLSCGTLSATPKAARSRVRLASAHATTAELGA